MLKDDDFKLLGGFADRQKTFVIVSDFYFEIGYLALCTSPMCNAARYATASKNLSENLFQ